MSDAEKVDQPTDQQKEEVQQEAQTPKSNLDQNSKEEASQNNDQQQEEQAVTSRIEIVLDTYNRLVKTGVYSSESKSTVLPEKNKVILDNQQQDLYMNGVCLANYLIFLKKHLKREANTDLNVEETKVQNLKDQNTPPARLYNWNVVCNELDKVGITIDSDVKSEIVAGDQQQIDRLFMRLERYMTKIASPDILNFDKKSQPPEAPPTQQIQKPAPNQQQSTKTQEQEKQQPKQSSQKEIEKVQLKAAISNSNRSQQQANSQKNKTDDSKSAQEQSSGIKTPTVSNQLKQVDQQANKKKKVKEGVDIAGMDINKQPSDTESSLEFILNTLSRAFGMKPRQAAALLTNNNQYLIHAMIKGVKTKFEPLISWCNEINANINHLSYLLQQEVQLFPKSAEQNFQKVLSTFVCGFYSHNLEVCSLSFKLLTNLFLRFQENSSQNPNVMKLSQAWYLSEDGALRLGFHSLKRHPEMAQNVIDLLEKFIVDQQSLLVICRDELQTQFKTVGEYINLINDLLPFMYAKMHEMISSSSILDFWVELCAREAENDGKRTNEERISALTLLSEIWITYTDYVDSKEEISNTIMFMLKRGIKDRNRSVRIISASYMFRLLEKFSVIKNQSAPIIYKSLIFSLVENPIDPTIREMYLSNFSSLLEATPSIPVRLLVEPLIKQIQVLAGVSFIFKVFDFDFFAVVSKHPKLQPAIAIQLLDLLAKVCLNDLSYASAASISFVQLCSRFISNEQVFEFMTKFFTLCLSMLMNIQKTENEEMLTSEAQFKKKKLPSHSSKANSNVTSQDSYRKNLIKNNKALPPKAQSRTSSTTNHMPPEESEQQMLRKIRKHMIVHMLYKIQNLRELEVNEELRQMLLSTNRRFMEVYRRQSPEIIQLLKFYGEPSEQIEQYDQKNPPAQRQDNATHLSISQDDSSLKNHRNSGPRRDGYDSEASQPHGNQGSDSKQVALADSKVRNSLAVIPYQGKGDRYGSQPRNIKAMQHIEKIRQSKKEKEEQKKLEEERLRLLSARKKKKLQAAIEQRRVELGINAATSKNSSIVATDQSSTAPSNLIVKQDKHPLNSRQKQMIQLVDLNEEEDRDQQAVQLYMKKYANVWKNLFQKYQGVGYQAKNAKNFDQLAIKNQKISLPEVTKLLKDHNMLPKFISKDEIAQLFRLVNTQVAKKRSDLQVCDYQTYLDIIVQIAYLSFTRPPMDLRTEPAVEYIRATINQFEQATREKGLSTLLYEGHAEGTNNKLVTLLNEKLSTDPNYPVPEGYSKIKEKVPVYDYSLSQQAQQIFGEPKSISIMIIDDLVDKLFGLHFLEPKVTFEDQVIVKQTITQSKGKAEALNYMKKIDRKQFRPNKMMALRAPKSNLGAELQLAVAQNQSQFENIGEVAEVLEEMLQAVSTGKTQLRSNQVTFKQNEFKKKVVVEEKKELTAEEKQKIIEKNKQIKADLAAAEEARKAKREEERQKKLAEEQRLADEKKRKEEKAKADLQARKEALLEKKKKNEQEKENQAAEEAKAKQQADEQKKKQQQEFMKQQKHKLQDQFKQVTNERQKLNKEQQEALETEKDYNKRVKQQMEQHIKDTTQDRIKEKEQKQKLTEFMEQEDVKKVFQTYNYGLDKYFKFYCSQGTAELGFDLEFRMNHMNQQEFVKFGYQSNVNPVLVSTEDVVFTFKRLIKEQIASKQSTGDQNTTTDNSLKNQAYFINFDSFKRGLVIICVIAQDYLGGQDDQKLNEKLNNETQNKEKADKKKEILKKRNETKTKIEQDVLKEMRAEFDQKQKLKQEALSKSPQKKPLNASNSEQQLTLSKVTEEQTEQDFQKWMKQQEVKGQGLQQRIQAKNDANSGADQDVGGSFKKNSVTSKQLVQLQHKQALKNQSLKIEKKSTAKIFDATYISAQTIEKLIQFLGIDSSANLEKTLNNQRIEIQGSKPAKIKKSTNVVVPKRLKTVKEDQNKEEAADEQNQDEVKELKVQEEGDQQNNDGK